jgi:hypothetical protein
MVVDYLPFLLGQAGWFEQDLSRDADLANVVEQGARFGYANSRTQGCRPCGPV